MPTTSEKATELLLASEAARLVGISRQRVHQMADCGDLPCERIGENRVRVFKRADVERLAQERERERRQKRGRESNAEG